MQTCSELRLAEITKAGTLATVDETEQASEGVEEILQLGLTRLRKLLGEEWTVEPVNRPVPQGEHVPAPGPPGDQVVYVQPPVNSGGGVAQVLVAARPGLSPLQARREFQASVSLMHKLVGQSAVLVIVPWL